MVIGSCSWLQELLHFTRVLHDCNDRPFIVSQVKHPNAALPPVLGASMQALASILSYDGLSGISLESAAMSTSMLNPTVISHFLPGRSIGTHKMVSSFCRPLSNYKNFTVHEANRKSILNDLVSRNLLPLPDLRTAKPSDPSSPQVKASSNSVYACSTLQSRREPKRFKRRKRPQNQDATRQQRAPECNTHKQSKSPKEQKAAKQQNPPSGGLSLNGHGSSVYGPYGTRGTSLKRPRGN